MNNEKLEGQTDSLVPNLQVTENVSGEVAPLNHEAALASYSEDEKREIIALADSIDVTQLEKVMNYGAAPLKATFEQCGAFLKDERGSKADQEVIAQVIALSKKAHETYDDFNLVLKEPNVIQRFLTKLMSNSENHTQKIKNSAVTNYQLLVELRKSCDAWLEMLRNAMAVITESAFSDIDSVQLLEKFIIAGKLAQSRIENELEEKQKQYQETGLQQYALEYDELKAGYDNFILKLNNLENSRVMYHLSLGQLALTKRSNTAVQISIHTQVDHSMALMSQQLRNAVLNAKTKEVLEGQKAITKLNDELIKDVSKTVGCTAEEAEQLIYAGFYNADAAMEAVTSVIQSCDAIQKTAEEMLPKMKANTEKLNGLIEKLQPYVDASKKTLNEDSNTLPNGRNGGNKLGF